MRQRLSSEPDRYRGRRRVPTPPRSQYAAVITTAFVGGTVVALGAGALLPDAKDVSPTVLADLENAAATDDDLAARTAGADRSSRATARAGLTAALPDAEKDVWVLPCEDCPFTAPFGVRWGELHPGIDLSAPEGTPFRAVHAGTVKSAGWMGGYGYAVVLDHGDGVQTLYGHAARLAVQPGQQVKAGDMLGEIGNSGFSYGAHLHLEVHVDNKPTDPVPFLRERDVDVKLQVEAVYSGLAAS